MSCCTDCGATVDEKSPVKKGCCKTNFIDPLYVPVYDPKCCPDPVNMDPKHNEVYQKPTLCRSEPLSHAEYIRKLKANNGVKLSVAASKAVTVGEGVYKRTIWTTAGDACSFNSDLVLPAAPAVLGHGKARDAWQYTEMKGAYAGRGTVSKFDSVNRTEDITRLRRQGLAIAGDDSFMAPANMKRTLCEVCTLVGTTDVDPGACGICGTVIILVLDNAIPNFTSTTNTFVGGTEPATWQAVASGQLNSFMNGTYLTTGSHFYGGNNVTNGSHQSFKRNLPYGGSGWVSRTASNTYDGLTGVYTGSTSTTISSAAVLGEYITITAPYSFILKQYNLVSGNNNIDGATATSWVIGGSNNGGTSWTHVDTRTGIAMPGRTATIDLESNTVSYSSYILVVTANAPKVGPNHAAANIDAWNLETLM